MRVDPLDIHQLFFKRQQVVNDGHGNLSHNAQAAFKQQIERMRYRAVRVVFDRDDSEASLTSFYSIENFVEVGLGKHIDVTPEESPDGLLGKCSCRPKECNGLLSSGSHDAPQSRA